MYWATKSLLSTDPFVPFLSYEPQTVQGLPTAQSASNGKLLYTLIQGYLSNDCAGVELITVDLSSRKMVSSVVLSQCMNVTYTNLVWEPKTGQLVAVAVGRMVAGFAPYHFICLDPHTGSSHILATIGNHQNFQSSSNWGLSVDGCGKIFYWADVPSPKEYLFQLMTVDLTTKKTSIINPPATRDPTFFVGTFLYSTEVDSSFIGISGRGTWPMYPAQFNATTSILIFGASINGPGACGPNGAVTLLSDGRTLIGLSCYNEYFLHIDVVTSVLKWVPVPANTVDFSIGGYFSSLNVVPAYIPSTACRS